MQQQRDLNRTRERIMAAAQKEFAANGFAGARTDAIARRAHVNERMIFYCFESKEGLYRAVLAKKLSDKVSIIESTPDEDFTTSLVKGFASACEDTDGLRMWQWEALDKTNRKLVAEEERRAYFQAEVARWKRAKAKGILRPDADEKMLMLVSAALRAFPLALPQVTSLVTGMDPLDPEFRERWTACLECTGRQLFAPDNKSHHDPGRGKNKQAFEQKRASIESRKQPESPRRLKSAVKAKS